MTKKSIFVIALIILVMACVTVFWTITYNNEDTPTETSTEATEGSAEETSTEESTTEEPTELNTEIQFEPVETTEQTEENIGQGPISGDESMTFTEVNEKVTSKNATNLRSTPSTLDETNVVKQLLNGDTITRTGINESTGWSRLELDGQVVYAVSQFLTTDLDYVPPMSDSEANRVTTQAGRVVIFIDCDDYVAPKEYVNLRKEPSTSQGETTVSVQITNDTVVHRTGYSPDAGWSRVEYNGQVLYVVSSMVYTTDAVAE